MPVARMRNNESKRGTKDTETRKSTRKSAANDTKDAPKSKKRPRKQYDSDALDNSDGDNEDAVNNEDGETSEDELSDAKKKPSAKVQAKRSPKKPTRPRKKPKADDDETSSEDGQEVVGAVVQAPTSGRVPPGQISQNTLDFLNHLKDPACNDREWFRLHEAPTEPVYRLAEQEWKDFVEALTDVLIEADPELPPLPPKDVIHRIYRDIRFSNDKTPYKKGFSASFSRSGRKGIFAGLKPGNESIIAAGLWCPGRQEIANIRTNLLRNSKRFRKVISAPKFVEFFGDARPHPKGGRQNIFGHEDELKVAPKGVAKDHPDIDILKCRTFAVVHKFTDSEVLDPNFRKTVASVAAVLQPFVHILNELLTVGGGTAVLSSDDDDDGDSDDRDHSGSEDEE